MRSSTFPAAVAIAAVALSGCGGGGSAVAPHALQPLAGARQSLAFAPDLRAQAARAGSGAVRHALDVGGELPGMTLNIWWRANDGNDKMTSASLSETEEFSTDGQIEYVPAANEAGTAPIYRLYHGGSSPLDHMDSINPNEAAGYTAEGILGYPWYASSAPPGTADILRVLRQSPFDHATIHAGESLSGYGSDADFGLYGYPRYGNSGSQLTSLTAGGVTIGSNAVSGGALWSWVENGVQYVNTSDNGREIQSAFFYGNQNPTEAGDGSASSSAYQMHGSPIVQITNSGSTQSTRTVPLEWNPGGLGASSGNQVIAYQGMLLGKDITLGYDGLTGVAQYDTIVQLAQAVDSANLELPTGYMPSSFNTFYTYDASSDALAAVSPPNACSTGTGTSYVPPSGYGGVIIATSNGSSAMGVYNSTTGVGGPVDYFALWSFPCGNATSKWDNVRSGRSFPAGTSVFTSYIASGTLAQVRSSMYQLRNGIGSSPPSSTPTPPPCPKSGVCP